MRSVNNGRCAAPPASCPCRPVEEARRCARRGGGCARRCGNGFGPAGRYVARADRDHRGRALRGCERLGTLLGLLFDRLTDAFAATFFVDLACGLHAGASRFGGGGLGLLDGRRSHLGNGLRAGASRFVGGGLGLRDGRRLHVGNGRRGGRSEFLHRDRPAGRSRRRRRRGRPELDGRSERRLRRRRRERFVRAEVIGRDGRGGGRRRQRLDRYGLRARVLQAVQDEPRDREPDERDDGDRAAPDPRDAGDFAVNRRTQFVRRLRLFGFRHGAPYDRRT